MQAAAQAWAEHGRAILAFERAQSALDEEVAAIERNARERGWDGPALRRAGALRWESARMAREARRERAAREASAIAQTLTGAAPAQRADPGTERDAGAQRPRPSTAARAAAEAAVGGMIGSRTGAGAATLEDQDGAAERGPERSAAARAAADAALRGMTPPPRPAAARESTAADARPSAAERRAAGAESTPRSERRRASERTARAAAQAARNDRAQARAEARAQAAREDTRAARAAQAARAERHESDARSGGTPLWAWALMVYAALAGSVMAAMWGYRLAQRQPEWFRRKAEQGRGPALVRAGRRRASADDDATGGALFVERERESRLGAVRAEIERRYPLLDAQDALGKAALIGAGALVGAVGACWMLKIPVTGALGAGAALGAFAWGGWASLRWQQRRREALFAKQFPETVDQIVRLAGAGVPSVEALAVVTEDSTDPVKSVLGEVNDALKGGVDAEKALRMTTERIRLAEFTMFAAVLRLQRRSGGGVTRAFGNLSETLRNRRKTELQRQASTAQTRLTILVLAVMPALVLLVQKMTSPKSVEVLFGTESGTMLLRWGVGLVIAGVITARWIGARGMR